MRDFFAKKRPPQNFQSGRLQIHSFCRPSRIPAAIEKINAPAMRMGVTT